MGAYEQELYMRRIHTGDVAVQTKAQYCTGVNT